MPMISQQKVIDVLTDHYFDHHTAMHLARERVPVMEPGDPPKVVKVQPIPNPDHHCTDCQNMTPTGQPRSGLEFLQMHHDMIRVFQRLLQKEGISFGVEWKKDQRRGEPSRSQWCYPSLPEKVYDDAKSVIEGAGLPSSYTPKLWDLDRAAGLPEEIRGMFSHADSDYLHKVFEGIKPLRDAPQGDPNADDGPVAQLGQYIERGVDPGKTPNGSGFHNTVHEYLGSREGKAATGAEMNRLRTSLFNDYFWSLHLWVDGQYGRLLENLGQEFDTSPQEPDDSMQKMTPEGAKLMAAMRGNDRVHRATHQRTGTLPKARGLGHS